MNLREKLTVIQSKLIAPKNQYNSFGKYKYRSCEDILEGLKPLLAETKTALTINDDIVEVGNRIYVKATATLFDTESDDNISNSAFAREEENKKGMDSSQVTGATSSYARKYALNGLFAIDDTKDADATNTHGNEDKAEVKKATPAQIEALKKVYTGDNMDKLLKANNISAIEDLPLTKASEIIKKLKEKKSE